MDQEKEIRNRFTSVIPCICEFRIKSKSENAFELFFSTFDKVSYRFSYLSICIA